MQGIETDNAFKIFKLLIAKNCGFGQLFAAVRKSVTDCGNLGNVGNNPLFLIREQGEHTFDCRLVVGESHVCFVIGVGRTLVGDNAVNPNSFAEPLGEYFVRRHIKKLIFERGASCIYNEDFHFLYSLYIIKIYFLTA